MKNFFYFYFISFFISNLNAQENRLQNLIQGFSNWDKARDSCSINNNPTGGGICANINLFQFVDAGIGIECLRVPGEKLTKLLSFDGLNFDCYCLGSVSSQLSPEPGLTASLSLEGIKTFGKCHEVQDYEGGFLDVGFSVSLKDGSGVSFNLGTGIDLQKLKKTFREMKTLHSFGAEYGNCRMKYQMKAFIETIMENDKTKAVTLPLLTSARMFLGENNEDKTLLNSIAKKILPSSKMTNSYEVLESLNKTFKTQKSDHLHFYHRPLLALYQKVIDDKIFLNKWHQYKNTCDEHIPSPARTNHLLSPKELKLFFERMLYSNDGSLGSGFLGTCHAMSGFLEFSKGISSQITPVKILPKIGYSHYNSIGRVSVTINPLSSLNAKQDPCFSEMGLLEKIKTKIRALKSGFNKCADAAKSAVMDPVDFCRSLMSDDAKKFPMI